MITLYPAIDLSNGHCVRLYQGDFNQVTAYNNNPVEVAMGFEEQGAKWLHVVDLDGTKDAKLKQFDIIENIVAKTSLSVQVGGGIGEQQTVEKLFSVGVSRVVVGSQAIKSPENVKRWIDIYGADRIVLALDVRISDQGIPLLAISGWQEQTNLSLHDLIDDYASVVKHILCTDIERDGAMQGVNSDLYADLMSRYSHLCIQASGGVSSYSDIDKLIKLSISGVIFGRSLYENKINLKTIIERYEAC